MNKIVLQLCKEDLIFQIRERHCWKFLFPLLPPTFHIMLWGYNSHCLPQTKWAFKFFGFLLEAEYCNKEEKDILTSTSTAIG